MNQYVKLAKNAINEFVKNGKVLKLPDDAPKEIIEKRAGVFVSIHKKPINLSTMLPQVNSGQVGAGQLSNQLINQEGELRGCIGTFLPTKANIALEIIDNAISACSRDYRFEPVRFDELEYLEISVDVLNEPELITNNLINPSTALPQVNSGQVGAGQLTSQLINQLNVKKYGVIVKSDDGKTGLLLPDLEGVDTPDQQITICKQKAGINFDEPIDIYRFEVTRYKE
ncbi:MAG: AMMECR1 protein [uncultured bacterium]|nr:MAG: AMMECR1 protein [uncultured bacterium]